jgi:branched-chain amino acid aminotransferase
MSDDTLQVYIDGQLYPKPEAKISVYDHGFLYGDGVFEGIRAYNGRVWRLREHLERLYRSAKAILLEIPLNIGEMREAVFHTLRVNKLRDAYIRLIVSRGVGDLGLDPRKCKKPSVVIITDRIQLYPPEFYEKGMEIVTVTTRRNAPDVLNPGIKSMNYLNNILAKIEVIRAGVQEGLMLNQQGLVAECTGDNIFIATRNVLYTPASHMGILEGITRAVVLEMAAEFGLPVREDALSLLQVYGADECFLTGTGAEIVPVVRIDGRDIGDGQPGPVTRRMMARFREKILTEGEPVEGLV